MDKKSPATVLAVSQRVDRVEGRGEKRDAVDQRLIRWLEESGFVPVPVPNALCRPDAGRPAEALDAWLDRLKPGGVVLSGGNDIGDEPERDRTEARLLERAEAGGWPVLGICRGLQMMTVQAGGSLGRVEGHVAVRHALESGEGEWPAEVNSYHELGLEGCPPGYEVAARSPDGGIEALVHRSLPREGWMWHPEREETPAPEDRRRLRALFGTARTGRQDAN